MLAVKPIQVSSAVDNEENQPLSPMARSFHEPDSNVYVIVMIGLKSKINSKIVKANLQHTLLKHHRFSSLQVILIQTPFLWHHHHHHDYYYYYYFELVFIIQLIM